MREKIEGHTLEVSNSNGHLVIKQSSAFDESDLYVDVYITSRDLEKPAQLLTDAGPCPFGQEAIFRSRAYDRVVQISNMDVEVRITNSHGCPIGFLDITSVFSE